jgi:pyruvate kinase
MSSNIDTFRRTKIIFTLGPATESEEMLETLLRDGADVIRLNMAHATHEWTRKIIARIRSVSARIGIEVAIMMDIKGPEIRTGVLDNPIELKPGEIFDFTVKPGTSREQAEEIRSVDVNYQDLVKDINVGDIVLVDNGLIQLEVLSKESAHIRCKVLIPGELKSKRHINLPGVKVNLPAFTEKDRGDTLVGIEAGIDFVALSFVRSAEDVIELREFLKANNSKAWIVAKIEDQSAVNNLESIVDACDALMVARGDLGIECPFEDLPVIQRRAVNTCITYGKPVIIATHMLESMITQPVPTRAEITDVANAVYEKADCVMLSGETTVGKYPRECVEMLSKIAKRIEREESSDGETPTVFIKEKMKVLHSAVVLSNQIVGSSIVTFTRQGTIACGLAALRPVHAQVFAFTPDVQLYRKLRLLRSIVPMLMPFALEPQNTIENAVSMIIQQNRVKSGGKLIIVTDIIAKDRLVDSVQLRTLP